MNSRQKRELNRHKKRSEIARQADLEVMASSPTPKTWSATMPAYCYTELCPVAEMRTARKRKLNLASGAGEEN